MPAPNYLPPKALQIIGIILLFAFAGFWAATGRESVLLVSTAGGLIMLGGYQDAKAQLVAAIKPPDPPDESSKP